MPLHLSLPTLYQSYGSLPYVLPNFDLKPETNASHELISVWKEPHELVVGMQVFSTERNQMFFVL